MSNNIKYWMSPDSEKSYSPLNHQGTPNYGKDEIIYQMNSLDFRCDEFDKSSELSIIFMGCSFTEGIGLPLNEVWTYHLHSKISEVTKRKIPFWSLARGGSSIDFAAKCFYTYADELRPKYVFYLMSGISRREYRLNGNNDLQWWPNPSKLFKPDSKFKTANLFFSDIDFALHQAHRSLMIMNSVAKLYQTKIYIIDLKSQDGIDYELKQQLFSEFDRIDYSCIVPLDLNVDIPQHLLNRPFLARDNAHPGAAWQYRVYSYVWDKVKINFINNDH